MAKQHSLCLPSVLLVRDILKRIRIRGSVPLITGSGSGSCFFRHWTSRWQLKIFIFAEYVLFEATFTSFFITSFCLMIEGSGSVSLTNGSGGPKTYGSYGSGCAILPHVLSANVWYRVCEGFVDMRKVLFMFPLPHGRKCLLLSFFV